MFRSAITVMAAIIFALCALFLPWLPSRVQQTVHGLSRAVRPLRHLHSGHIGDCIVWFPVGVAAMGGLLPLALR